MRRSSCSGCLPKRWSLLPRGKGKAICCPALLPASSVCFLLASWPLFLCLIAPSLLFFPSASVCFLLASCLLLTLFSLFVCPFPALSSFLLAHFPSFRFVYPLGPPASLLAPPCPFPRKGSGCSCSGRRMCKEKIMSCLLK